MEAFLVSLSTVALAEIGDRTQLLSLLLASRFRQPLPIIGGVLCATLVSHAAASLLGVWVGHSLSPAFMDGAVGASMILMAAWMLKPDKLEQPKELPGQRGIFLTTTIAFLIAETGDKTQIATLALAAGYRHLGAVIAGTTCGMLLANVPVILLGKLFADKLPMRAIHSVTCALLLVIGILFLLRAVHR